MRSRLVLVLGLLFGPTLPAAAPAPQPSAQLRALDREIERLRAELVEAGRAQQAGEGLAAGQRARLAELNRQEAALKARMDANRNAQADLLGALQSYQRRPPPPLLVDPRSARDAVRAAILIRAMNPELEARARAFAKEADDIARLRRQTAAASAALFATESSIEDRRGRIDRLMAEKKAVEMNLYADDGAPDPAARALAARAGSVEAFVRGLTPRAEDAAPPAAGPRRLATPVQGVVVRRFGQPSPQGERAQGWTWRAAEEAMVLSPAAGRVDYAGPLKGWGEVLILNVGGGRRLVLAGLQAVSVGVGRAVGMGEPVGRLGKAEPKGAGPELYMELRSGGGAVDPAPLLNAAAPATATTAHR